MVAKGNGRVDRSRRGDGMERKLKTIVAMDVVGYSRLIADDIEAMTHPPDHVIDNLGELLQLIE